MTPKERFTVATTIGKNGLKVIRGVYDHKQEKHISESEAEHIFFQEYGVMFNVKKLYVEKVVDIIHKEIQLYNSSCEKGFEITFEDVINKFKK